MALSSQKIKNLFLIPRKWSGAHLKIFIQLAAIFRTFKEENIPLYCTPEL
jgi:hypothetical protein